MTRADSYLGPVLAADIEIMARTIYGEARGENLEGKRAVAHVIINRLVKRVGDRDHTLAEAALRWRQFSAWNEGDPNRELLMHVDLSFADYRECMIAALMALNEPDPLEGATHYHAEWAKESTYWAQDKEPVRRIGKHWFYNNVR